MKQLLIIPLLILSAGARATAYWDITLHQSYGSDPYFSLVGQFTTADADINRGTGEVITSFTGTLTDLFVTNASVTLIPPGQTVEAAPTTPPLVFQYDDRFYGPSDPAGGFPTGDAFNYNGLLLRAGPDVINIFGAGLLIAYDYDSARNMSTSYAITTQFVGGDPIFGPHDGITLDHVTSPTAVPEPANLGLMFLGLLPLWVARRLSRR